MGLRIIEQINLDCRTGKPKYKPIDVYFPEDQLNLLDKFLIRKRSCSISYFNSILLPNQTK